MKALVYHKYGSSDVLKLAEVETPVPSDNEVLIKLHAVSINGSDKEALVGRPLYVRMGGIRKPGYPILGSDIAGRVERVGSNVKQFQPGDEVFGELPGYHGGFAEYACATEATIVHKPASLTFEQAAAIPQGGGIALQGIREKGQVQPGQHVLINGAGGSAGTFAIQLAKLYDAEVTGVDNAGKLEFLRSLGADHAIDYTREDFTKRKNQYDLILDVVAHRSVFAYARALKPNGTYFFVGGSVATLFQILLLRSWVRRTRGKNVRLLVVPQDRKQVLAITELCEAGKVTPVIDKTFPLSQGAEALRYVEQGHARGKVIITME